MHTYDAIIIGGGPAGLTAGLYASRSKLDVILLEQMATGGLIAATELVENYPGFPDGIMGADLAASMEQQATKFGLKIEYAETTAIKLDGDLKIVETSKGNYQAKNVILATGSNPRMTGMPNEQRLFGRGISTCATCDGPLYRDQTVGVIGGGDSAIQESVFLAKFAQKVYVFHRRDELRAVKALQDKAFAEPKIEIVWNALFDDVVGDDEVKGLRYHDKISGEELTKEMNGLFIFIGLIPRSELLENLADKDEAGFIITDENMLTKTPGVYAVGDVRSKLLRQVATAVADGAIAAFHIETTS